MSNQPPGPPKRPRAPPRKFTVMDALIELLKVRSIITIIIIGTVSYLTAKEIQISEGYMALGGAVVTYFFMHKKGE